MKTLFELQKIPFLAIFFLLFCSMHSGCEKGDGCKGFRSEHESLLLTQCNHTVLCDTGTVGQGASECAKNSTDHYCGFYIESGRWSTSQTRDILNQMKIIQDACTQQGLTSCDWLDCVDSYSEIS